MMNMSFTDVSYKLAWRSPRFRLLGGRRFIDYDNDGWLICS